MTVAFEVLAAATGVAGGVDGGVSATLTELVRLLLPGIESLGGVAVREVVPLAGTAADEACEPTMPPTAASKTAAFVAAAVVVVVAAAATSA
jgi:hypothetical protein